MNRIYDELIEMIRNNGLFKTMKQSRSYIKERTRQRIGRFSFCEDVGIKEDIQRKYSFSGELLDMFIDSNKTPIHKWHHYIPIYDKYFNSFRGKKVRFLEIGVSRGGSLQMWRNYFGPAAIIYGIDINPECLQYDKIAGEVRIGSQSDQNFLASVVEEMGGVDIVLDDGSHRMKDISSSLKTLFPKMNDSGVYLIEDLHTAYWKKWGGGYKKRDNFFNTVRDLIDDMHHWYHIERIKNKNVGDRCSSIHIHDSIVVLEKGACYRPTHSHIFNTSS